MFPMKRLIPHWLEMDRGCRALELRGYKGPVHIHLCAVDAPALQKPIHHHFSGVLRMRIAHDNAPRGLQQIMGMVEQMAGDENILLLSVWAVKGATV